ncbi:hypothetical protein M5D96_001358 [Drosophila gunungcola]|uniref:Uncharacterized protein n=1 Tax=Drosophila gunungcola TaxID=103775 RepID=A0A9P9YYT4_9MUSC|nr:hypothetical protein M5D96_001358 [Drosophila gunungcola]
MHFPQLILFGMTISANCILIPPFCDILVLDTPLKCYHAKDCEAFRKCLGPEYQV